MDNKKKLIIGGVVVIAAAAVGYYFYSKSKKPKTEGGDSESGGMETRGASAPVRSDLNWVQNKAAASYLSGLLSDSDGTRLRGWVNLIQKERLANPSKWKDANDLTGQVGDVAHALWQMKIQKPQKAKYTPSNSIWTNEVKFALQDAQNA